MGVFQRGLLAGAESGPRRKPQLCSQSAWEVSRDPLGLKSAGFLGAGQEKEDEALCQLHAGPAELHAQASGLAQQGQAKQVAAGSCCPLSSFLG